MFLSIFRATIHTLIFPTTNMNHCTIPVNKIHELLFDVLEDAELCMDRLADEHDINKIIKSLFSKSAITSSISYNTSEENYIAMTHKIANSMDTPLLDDENPKLFFDTCYLEMNDDYTYELVFNDTSGTDDTLNHFATITNNDQIPIYNTCCVVKCNNNKVPQTVTVDDVVNIYINMYYHKGLMLRQNGEKIEMTFSGTQVEPFLKSGFKQTDSIFMCGLNLVIYCDEDDGMNENATKLFEQEMKGNVFIAMLCPISGKYFANFTEKTFNTLSEIVKNGYRTVVEENVMEIAGNNPFLVIEKYK